MLPFLLAQLVAPPLQNGPVRLPGSEIYEQRKRPKTPRIPITIDQDETTPVESPQTPSTTPELQKGQIPTIKGFDRYSQVALEKILVSCSKLANPIERLNACAAALTAQLVKDGYVNTRVYVEKIPAPGYLDVVEGRIVELRVESKNKKLASKVQRLLRPLQGQVLHLPTIQRDLDLLKQLPGVEDVRIRLGRLGSDPSQAVFQVTVEPAAQPWQGELAIRNDGSGGSGEFRSTATLVKSDLALSGDTLLIFGELDTNDKAAIGFTLGSISYTLPIADQLSFSGSFGYSLRNLIEQPYPTNKISSESFQGFGQFDYTLKETLSSRWSAFLGMSANRSNTYLFGKPLPDVLPEISRIPSYGYLRAGIAGNGLNGPVAWNGNIYLLQGIGFVSSAQQRAELAETGIVPGEAIALGGLLSGSWGLAQAWQLNFRVGGQVAFTPLTSAMQFSLGSDVGLRGLPGSLISGDNGWLGTSELVWTAWQQGSQSLQFVPFIGAGGVYTSYSGVSFNDTVGSGGILARYLAQNHWAFELGWVKQFSTNNNDGVWKDWILGNGLYAKAQYRF